jgi:proton glutamate symport protein
MDKRNSSSLVSLRFLNRPIATISAIAVAVALGLVAGPLARGLRPLGDLYVALLQMCVLPFLLAAIPLAVRSAIGATASRTASSFLISVCGAIVVVGLIGAAIPAVAFHLAPFDRSCIAAIGSLVGGATGHVDIEFALDNVGAAATAAATASGPAALIPSNIFAALSANDTIRVLVFGALFGTVMVAYERRSGSRIFSGLQHLHDVCLLMFDWLNLLAPIGIVSLIAPQIALLGADAFVVLARFSGVFAAVSVVVLGLSILLTAVALRLSFLDTVARLFRPIMLGAATRNTIACIPSAIETMTIELRVPREACELCIPLGFATLRFGTMLYFAAATIFIGALVGESFGPLDALSVAALSFVASFGTLGLSGAAALVPLAAVLRPFGLSYELAFPLLVVVDPAANMVRVMLNIAVNCLIPVLAAGRARPESVALVAPAAAE